MWRAADHVQRRIALKHLHESFSSRSIVSSRARRNAFIWCAVAVALLSASCATVGRDFPTDKVSEIQVQVTTRDEIRSMFGSPWRVGIDDGLQSWTYGRYHYRLFGETSTKDLVVRFDGKGIVAFYTFNATEPGK
jgi:hypothetical protein